MIAPPTKDGHGTAVNCVFGIVHQFAPATAGRFFDGEDQIEDALDARLATVEEADLSAARHHEDAIGVLDDLLEVRRDQNDRHAFVAEAADGLENLLLGAEVDAAGRLVEEEDAWLPVQPLADDELLLVAAGKVEGVGVEPIGIEAELPGDRRRLRCAARAVR